MREADPWRCALPYRDAIGLVGDLVDAFYALERESSHTYHFGLHETKLTKRLANRLENMRARACHAGMWQFEQGTNTFIEDDPRRLDITYCTVVDNTVTILLVFECKKIRAGARGISEYDRKQYIQDGMRRFVIGSYAPREAIGFMVSMSDQPHEAVVTSLKRSLSSAGSDAWLGLTKTADGKLWMEPSRRFAPHAAFSTVHQRIVSSSNYSPEIVLYHVPLQFRRHARLRPTE